MEAIYWRKEAQGCHRAYADGKELACIQGDGVAGWRYMLATPGARAVTVAEYPDWSERYATVQAAKKAALAVVAPPGVQTGEGGSDV